MRINRVTTKTGDKGKTRLGNGQMISKDAVRIRCLGGLDEINAGVGLALAVVADETLKAALMAIQNELLSAGGEIALPDKGHTLITEKHVADLENQIESMNDELPPLEEFVLPGGAEFAARIHLVRTVCRRVETDLVALDIADGLNPALLKYINRLSDYFFVLARWYNLKHEQNETLWNNRRSQ